MISSSHKGYVTKLILVIKLTTLLAKLLLELHKITSKRKCEREDCESYTDGGVKMLPITKMIYNQSILTTTQYEDQPPGDK
jgi:hypothetical protein